MKVQPAKQSFAYPLGQPVRAAAKYPARPEFYPVKVLPDRHMYSKTFYAVQVVPGGADFKTEGVANDANTAIL